MNADDSRKFNMQQLSPQINSVSDYFSKSHLQISDTNPHINVK
jgi:hypothetical protein